MVRISGTRLTMRTPTPTACSRATGLRIRRSTATASPDDSLFGLIDRGGLTVMWWILFVVVQALVIVSGIRNEQRAGLWSWSKFAFALGFAALEVILVLVPLNYIDWKSRWFAPVMTTASVI